ncbi:PREDICTED: vacuolar fusion protein MON1 homolog A-like [Priapulus caudatus]|uniref:Vacuolar fusion protein MON1 homolog n=1 Tax=Priapulus caudatus TaxID=37621 RepID=A0ABM1F0R7_PRICU|nr:PREDICTED: vacuolar fusion protein MON1 homolog A-like [Priapulus caudatus]
MAASSSSSISSCSHSKQPPENDDISRLAPGISKDSVLLATNSFADICECFNEQCEQFHRVKHHSGSISELGHSLSREGSQPIDGEEATEDTDLEQDACFVIEENNTENHDDDFQSASEDPSDAMSRSIEKLRLVEEEQEDIINNEEWQSKRKHVFILSEAGKPIYSRYGSEDQLVTMMGVMQALVACVQDARDSIRCIVAGARRWDLVFAIIIADKQLVTMVRMRKYSLHPVDLHLILNLVSSSTTSFQTGETWSPICLPKFDSSGYLYAHISYLDDKCNTCMLLLTVNRDEFFTLSECKKKVLERLQRYRCLEAIDVAIAEGGCRVSQIGIADLRHFIYKSRSTSQFVCAKYEAPYTIDAQWERLFSVYQRVHHRIHTTSRPLKILFYVGVHETILGWVTSGFELYATFSPLVTKPVAIAAVEKLLRWIKREEDRLFILKSLTF